MKLIDKVIVEIKEGKWDEILKVMLVTICPKSFGFLDNCREYENCKEHWERELTEREKKLLKAVDEVEGEWF